MAPGTARLRDVPLPISGLTGHGEDGIQTPRCSAGFWGEQGPQDAEAAPWPCSEGCPPADGGPRPGALSSQSMAQLWAAQPARGHPPSSNSHQDAFHLTASAQLVSQPGQVLTCCFQTLSLPGVRPETFRLDWGKGVLGPTPFGFNSCIWSFQAGAHRTRL